MAKSDVVVVAHRDVKGKTVYREFTPETVDSENPAHKGKTHVDLANDFVAKHKDKGAHIVKGVSEAPAVQDTAESAQQPAPAIPGVEVAAAGDADTSAAMGGTAPAESKGKSKGKGKGKSK